MKNLLNLNFTSPNGSVVKGSDGSVTFSSKRAPIGEKFLPSSPFFSFVSDEFDGLEEYVVLEYSCYGLKRPTKAKQYHLFSLNCGDESTPLISYSDITIDRQKHTVIVKTPKCSFKTINAGYCNDKIIEAFLKISKLYTCTKDELPISCEKGFEKNVKNFTPIDISDKFDKEYNFDEFDTHIDSGLFFNKENVSLYGVPFNVKPNGKNLIAPAAPPCENDEIINNFGAEVKRRYCRPVSRDGETYIEIGKKASEIYFVLSLSGKRYIRCLYGSEPTILGGQAIDLDEPLKVTDAEFFMVEVVYKDGRRDTHLPLNLGTARHGISGDIGVYAVPCFGEVERVVVHNRLLDTDVNIAAVTVNETDDRLYPDMLIPEKAPKLERDVCKDKKLSLDGSILTVTNGAVFMKLDISKGLCLCEFSNAYTPGMKFKNDAVLKIRSANGDISDVFELCDAKCAEDIAVLTYKYEGAEFVVSVDISGEDNVMWQLEITNKSDAEFRKGIIFPSFTELDFGSFSDNWYYLPKYQNIDSNETFFMYEESAPSFPLQFMEVYSPEMQGGLCISTQERELVTRKYALEKHDRGIDVFVEYPIIYGDIAPEGKFKASPCLVTAHEGGWQKAFAIYKSWLDSWYEPYKCQNKQWYRECFWLLAEITDFYERVDMCKFPCWYDPETKQFNFRKILEEQKKIAGVYPDILHMWSWCFTFRNGEYGQRWGNFGDVDYDAYGGVESFKNALHDIRDNMGVEISLYMHPTLLTNSYKKFDEFKDTSMVINEGGGHISIEGDSFRMCHAEEKFRNASLSMYPRLYSELKIPLLYVDEFSLRIGNRCFAKDHGHHVPSNLLKTDRDYITRLKEIMPEEVVLYGEYAAADVNARYIDCNISYYILDSIVDMIETSKRANDGDDRLSRVFMHAYRFAFPKLVQLILPMAMRNISWHPQKFMFFNAEAIYDSFWDNEESRGLDFTVKAYKLKKKYADCFTSDNPETMIETESPAVCMNKFPSKDRTVYTVYNRAYSTYRGKILRVLHNEGAVYYDAWNEKVLEYKVVDGYAELYLEIGAQQMGCIVIE